VRRPLIAVAVILGTLAAPAPAAADTFTGTVGPSDTITLINEAGNRVTSVEPGVHTFQIRDRSEFHSFHLSGPGVDMRTGTEFIGEVTWTVTVLTGRYTFFCDVHPSTMRGTFSSGIAVAPPPPAPPKRLVATVGPGFTITLRNAAGARVRSLRAGAYVISVRDRSRVHNFHLAGPGVNKRTGVAFRGTATWRVRLRRGTYRFVCDPHARQLNGRVRVT
jgi:plastocyanin